MSKELPCETSFHTGPQISDNIDYLSILPVEILYKIFDLCEVNDQLTLAKTSKYFQQMVRAIYKKKFKYMEYSCTYLRRFLNFDDLEITELCRLCAGLVERICLETLFISRFYYNSSEKEREFYKFHCGFQNNVQYFGNLLELKITGNSFPEETILILAKYCKKLKTIKFSVIQNYRFNGTYLQQLQGIENLHLQNCHKLDFNALLTVSGKRNLKFLNLLGCYNLYDTPKFIELCNHWSHLESVKLFAFTTDNQFLNAIINLPSLKTLQLYWEVTSHWATFDFEEQFFLELYKHQEKAVKLKHISFTNEKLIADVDKDLLPKIYATHKEGLYANHQTWQWSNKASMNICKGFENLKNLQTINFNYCRPLSNDKLFSLVNLNTQLELIKILGCPKADDEDLKWQWLNLKLFHKCQLELQSYLTLAEVEKIYDNVAINNGSSNIAHCMLCQFG